MRTQPKSKKPSTMKQRRGVAKYMPFAALLSFIVPTLAQAESPEQTAERLYYQARYDAALNLLGESCEGAEAPAECERVRAFVMAAKGDTEAAKEAFARMLIMRPETVLGEDVSPKMRALFESVREERAAVLTLALDEVVLESVREPWALKLPLDEPGVFSQVQVHIAPVDSMDFQVLDMRISEQGWEASFKPAKTGYGTAKYFFSFVLSNGEERMLGNPAIPINLLVLSADGKSGGEQSTAGPKKKLPPWALWTIVGVGAAAVIGGIAAAVVLSQEAPPGQIVVGVEFQNVP